MALRAIQVIQVIREQPGTQAIRATLDLGILLVILVTQVTQELRATPATRVLQAIRDLI